MKRSHRTRTDGPFALVPCDVLTSEAVRTLPNLPFRVLVAIAAQYNGGRNGSLTLTRDTARTFGISDPHGLGASLRELEARGLIVCTRPGSRIPPLSAMYAVTWRQIDEPLSHDAHDARPSLKPTNAYAAWKAQKAGQHWTAKRRVARWGMPTSTSGASIHENGRISGACLHKEATFSVGRAYHSQSSAVPRSLGDGCLTRWEDDGGPAFEEESPLKNPGGAAQ